MIERLETTPITDKDGNCYGTRNPSDSQYMDKINELVDALNELIKYIGVPDKLKTL